MVDARKESFNFLGFAIRVSKSWKSGNRYTHICPAPESLAKIKDRITQLTLRERTPIPLEDITGSMNAALRGWVNYFHYRNSSRILDKVKTHAEERLRTHLMKQHKIRESWNRLRPISEPKALCVLWAIQSSDNGGLKNSTCLGVKNIGKPCAGKPHARFDEGRAGESLFSTLPILLYYQFRRNFLHCRVIPFIATDALK